MADLQPYAEHDEPEGRTAFFLPLLAAALILALIGVISVVNGGDDGGVDDPAALILGAPDALQEAGSARSTMSMKIEGGAMSMDFGGEGLVDFVTGAATFEMSIMGQTMEMRTDGETLWMKMPEMGLPPGTEGSWLEVPADELPGVSTSGLTGASSEGWFDALRGLSGEVEDLGTEEVNGVDTNHYRFEVSIDAALEELDTDDRAELEQSFSVLGDVDSIPVELWITDDGLPVRQLMVMDLAEGPLEGSMRIQVDMSDFGVDVDVEPPPADEIISFDDNPELEEMFGSGTPS